MDPSTMITLILGGLLVAVFASQLKFKNKMKCYFIRPNRTRIVKWVPLNSKEVTFKHGKTSGQYRCDPECIAMEWYTGGFNRFFPILIPTLEFKWDTPNPLDPKTHQSTWHTPEARQAAWEEHQHISFAKAAVAQSGRKSRFPEWFFPLITIALVLIVAYLVYSFSANMTARMDMLEQGIKLIR